MLLIFYRAILALTTELIFAIFSFGGLDLTLSIVLIRKGRVEPGDALLLKQLSHDNS